MKLSEAIKEGKKKSGLPQLFGNGYYEIENGEICGLCALGYAAYAIKDEYPQYDFYATGDITDMLYHAFPLLNTDYIEDAVHDIDLEEKFFIDDFFDEISLIWNDEAKLDAEVIAEKVAERES